MDNAGQTQVVNGQGGADDGPLPDPLTQNLTDSGGNDDLLVALAGDVDDLSRTADPHVYDPSQSEPDIDGRQQQQGQQQQQQQQQTQTQGQQQGQQQQQDGDGEEVDDYFAELDLGQGPQQISFHDIEQALIARDGHAVQLADVQARADMYESVLEQIGQQSQHYQQGAGTARSDHPVAQREREHRSGARHRTAGGRKAEMPSTSSR